MRLRRVGIAIVMVLGALTACRQLVGIGDQPAGDGPACGGFAAIFGPDAAPGCQSCLQGVPEVCAAAARCTADPDCQEALQCTQVGPFQDQFQACLGGHPSGVAARQLLSDLQNKAPQCVDPCALGSQWSCLGHVSTPVVAVNADASFTVRDFLTGQPMAGVRVQACSPGEAPLPGPMPCPGQPSGVTDDAGVVSLTISGNTFQQDPPGYLSLMGSQQLHVEPMLFYWGFPTTEPSWQLGIYALTTDDLAQIGQGLQDALGITLLQNRAIVAVEANDCWGTYIGAPGVRFTITPSDPETQVIYESDTMIFSRSADRTGHTGNAFIVNVPVDPDGGSVEVTAKVASTGQTSATINPYVLPNTVTGYLVSPTE